MPGNKPAGLKRLLLLDIDGVLVTTPAWRAVEIQADGFMKFNERAVRNLRRIIDQTQAGIVLTTTHRITYSVAEWGKLLETRGIHPASIAKINSVATVDSMAGRAVELEAWVSDCWRGESYVIIDDDLAINRLPQVVRKRCVLTKPLIGLDDEATANVLAILLGG